MTDDQAARQAAVLAFIGTFNPTEPDHLFEVIWKLTDAVLRLSRTSAPAEAIQEWRTRTATSWEAEDLFDGWWVTFNVPEHGLVGLGQFSKIVAREAFMGGMLAAGSKSAGSTERERS